MSEKSKALTKSIDIKMGPELSIVSVIGDDGSLKTKNVRTCDLCNALSKRINAYSAVVPNGVKFIAEKGNTKYYAFIIPGEVRNMVLHLYREDITRYKSSDYPDTSKAIPDKDMCNALGINPSNASEYRVLQIPYPTCCVLVKVIDINKGDKHEYRYSNMYVWAIKNPYMHFEKMIACRWPFTNVYGDAHCCIGHINNVVDSIEAIASFPATIYNGIGNHDLDHSAILNKKGDLRFGVVDRGWDLAFKLHGSTSFPYEYLFADSDIQGSLKARILEIIGSIDEDYDDEEDF